MTLRGDTAAMQTINADIDLIAGLRAGDGDRRQWHGNIAAKLAPRHVQVRSETDRVFRLLLKSLGNPQPGGIRSEDGHQ